ncbi:MAG: hypothetical protein Ta2A_23150 [Treponemataceae bacterium]|nr:MAG: hypothetical protein Ta2A_23150 [Treponemataceae bacterium]
MRRWLVVFIFSIFPVAAEDFLPEQQTALRGRALSDYIFDTISASEIFSVAPNGEEPKAIISKQEIVDAEGFFYNIKIDTSDTSPDADAADDAKQILFVIPQEDAVFFIDALLDTLDTFGEFDAGIGAGIGKISSSFLLTAGDMSMLANSAPLGSVAYIGETEERIENIFALVFCNTRSGNRSKLKTPQLLRKIGKGGKINSPLIFEKALPLPVHTSFFLPHYANLNEFAENNIPSAGIIYDKTDAASVSAVFAGITAFCKNFSTFSGITETDYAEKNYTSMSINLGAFFKHKFFISEKQFMLIYLSIAAIIIFLSLRFKNFFIILAALNMLFFGAKSIPALLFVLLLYATAIIFYLKKMPRIIKFIPAAVCYTFFLTFFVAGLIQSKKNNSVNVAAANQAEEHKTKITYAQTQFFELNALHLTVTTALPLVKCSLTLNVKDTAAMFNSLMPFSVEENSSSRKKIIFNIPEYPPAPLQFEIYYASANTIADASAENANAIQSVAQSLEAEFYVFDAAENTLIKQTQKIEF